MSGAYSLMTECARRAAASFDYSNEDDCATYLMWAGQAALVVIAESLANHEQGEPDE